MNYSPFVPPSAGTQYNLVRSSQIPTKSMEPVQDNRYPAFAGIMSDSRLATDYRPHCARNLPPGTQFSTKQWMVSHASDIINVSRARQSEWSGAGLPLANTVPPPADYSVQSPFDNEIVPTNYKWGIGLERIQTDTPVLFGTYVVPPTSSEQYANVKKIKLTTMYEGGRNSLRGSITPTVKQDGLEIY